MPHPCEVPIKSSKVFLKNQLLPFEQEKIKGGGRVSEVHCILWMDDTVTCKTSPAFAIINSLQWQGAGMRSPQGRQAAHT